MPNNKLLKKAFLFPVFVLVFIIALSFLFNNLGGIALFLLYVEHLYIAIALGIDLNKHSSGGFIPFPVVPWVLVLSGVLDYLLLTAIAYGVLIVREKFRRMK